MTLTKNDIVEKVHEVGFTKKVSLDTVESLLEIIKQTLEAEEDVLISGFGKFCVKEKRERKGRNPATGEEIVIGPKPASIRVRVTALKRLKDMV